jgi:hypothetical protein
MISFKYWGVQVSPPKVSPVTKVMVQFSSFHSRDEGLIRSY